MSDLKTSFAFCVRKFLTKVLTPLTGFLQRQELPRNFEELSYWKKGIYYIIRWLSWCYHGAITLAYPHMRYNPIEARLQEAQWEWASEILHLPPKKIKKISTNYLFKQQTIVKNAFNAPSQRPSFTILICFHHHFEYFKNCLKSLQEALQRAPLTPIEILIINDDPSINLSPLFANLDPVFLKKIILRSHSENQGICSSLNNAITHAQGEWLLYLDCDDLLDPNVFLILEKTIQEHPDIRFISSRAADIDTNGDILFWRLRSEQPYELIKNNFANHLKVIKKELHQDLGLFSPTFEGCQDYEFALRTAIQEPLLFIPDYLYFYRWHYHSQTVSQNKRQNLTAMRVRQTYMLALYWLTQGTEMLEWNIIGTEAASWKQFLSSIPSKENSDQPHYQITLEATTPYNERRWKLLLVEIATIIIDHYRESGVASQPSLKMKIT